MVMMNTLGLRTVSEEDGTAEGHPRFSKRVGVPTATPRAEETRVATTARVEVEKSMV